MGYVHIAVEVERGKITAHDFEGTSGRIVTLNVGPVDLMIGDTDLERIDLLLELIEWATALREAAIARNTAAPAPAVAGLTPDPGDHYIREDGAR
jgi:hypothetical protein